VDLIEPDEPVEIAKPLTFSLGPGPVVPADDAFDSESGVSPQDDLNPNESRTFVLF
jgi:hypothetical protein